MSRAPSFVAGVLALLAVQLTGCGGEQLDREFWKQRGAEALTPFKMELMGALTKGLEEGPEAAIDVCQLLAPEIAEDVSSAGVEIGRTSHKLRNESNAPREWMQPLLQRYLAMPGKSEPQVVELEDGTIGYVEPIFVSAMCLACHGQDLSPGVASRLDAHYPRDRARGFREGDFRGMFWVELQR